MSKGSPRSIGISGIQSSFTSFEVRSLVSFSQVKLSSFSISSQSLSISSWNLVCLELAYYLTEIGFDPDELISTLISPLLRSVIVEDKYELCLL